MAEERKDPVVKHVPASTRLVRMMDALKVLQAEMHFVEQPMMKEFAEQKV